MGTAVQLHVPCAQDSGYAGLQQNLPSQIELCTLRKHGAFAQTKRLLALPQAVAVGIGHGLPVEADARKVDGLELGRGAAELAVDDTARNALSDLGRGHFRINGKLPINNQIELCRNAPRSERMLAIDAQALRVLGQADHVTNIRHGNTGKNGGGSLRDKNQCNVANGADADRRLFAQTSGIQTDNVLINDLFHSFSLITYPTPRTVWMSFCSYCASIFFRK